MPGEGKFSVRDNSREIGRTSVHLGDITAASLPGTLTAFGAYRTAIEGIILGVVATESLIVDETTLSSAAPASPLAQRGIKWTVTYSDNQPWFNPPANTVANEGYQKVFNFQLPTADLSLLATGQESLDLTAGAGLAFKTAFEALARSPYGGTVLLLSVTYTD